MTHRMTVLLVVVMMTGFLSLHRASAQSYRSTLGVSPVEVYQSMLSFADRKEYAKVIGSLNVLAPILDHIAKKYKENPADGIRKAVSKGDPEEILSSVRLLIAMDIKDLLDESLGQLEQSAETSKTLVRTARLNYELLSPFVQKKDFSADQRIKKNFTDYFRALGSESVVSSDRAKHDPEGLKRISEEILSGLSKVFAI